MNIKKDEHYLRLINERTLTASSKKGYYHALKHYSQVHKLTPTELINEADEEEEQAIRMKKRKIKKRLISFQTWLKEQNYSKNYIQSTMRQIRTFYSYFEIEIPKLPPLNLKETYHERYEDIPTIEHIKQAIESTNNIMYKAMILFMASSGSARIETHNLTVKQFVEATKEYHNNGTLETILNELETQKDIVPLFTMVRQKTDHPYYTCCSPECTSMIIKHLKNMENIKLNDKIFPLDLDSISRFFNRLNIKNKWGKKANKYNFFHPHALRKFNASAIEDIGFANTIQGRKADNITETYFKHNPKRIKEKYMEHLPKLTINKTVVNKVDDEATKAIKKENKKLREQQIKTNKRIAEIEDSNKEFKELFGDPEKLQKMKELLEK